MHLLSRILACSDRMGIHRRVNPCSYRNKICYPGWLGLAYGLGLGCEEDHRVVILEEIHFFLQILSNIWDKDILIVLLR